MIVVLVLDIPARMALYGYTYHALAPHMVEELFVFSSPPTPHLHAPHGHGRHAHGCVAVCVCGV
jgi:hypothetical protein